MELGALKRYALCLRQGRPTKSSVLWADRPHFAGQTDVNGAWLAYRQALRAVEPAILQMDGERSETSCSHSKGPIHIPT